MAFSTTLYTGSGYWNPVVWLCALALLSLIAYLFWRRGEGAYRRGTEQTKPFLSGNAEPPKEQVHLRSGHLYWGYTNALRKYYEALVPVHTGIMNDYILWFLGALAVTFILAGAI